MRTQQMKQSNTVTKELWNSTKLPRIIKSVYDLNCILQNCGLSDADVATLMGESGESFLHHICLNNVNCWSIVASEDEVINRLDEADANGITLESYLIAGLGTSTGANLIEAGRLIRNNKITDDVMHGAIKVLSLRQIRDDGIQEIISFNTLFRNIPMHTALSIDISAYEEAMAVALERCDWMAVAEVATAWKHSDKTFNMFDVNERQKYKNVYMAEVLLGILRKRDYEETWYVKSKSVYAPNNAMKELVSLGIQWSSWNELMKNFDGFKAIKEKYMLKEPMLHAIYIFWNDEPKRIYERMTLLSENVSTVGSKQKNAVAL